MTTTEITKPDKTFAYKILDDGINEIKNNYENSREIFNRVCYNAIKTGLTPKETWHYVLTKLSNDEYGSISERTLYRWAAETLPLNAKDPIKKKAGSLSHKKGVSVDMCQHNSTDDNNKQSNDNDVIDNIWDDTKPAPKTEKEPRALWNLIKDVPPILNDWKQALLDNQPILDQHPKLKNRIANEIKTVSNTIPGHQKARRIVDQYVHDLRTGAIEKDEDTGEYINLPSKREKLEDAVITSPRRDRAEIVELGMKLFKLVTDVDLDTNDLDQSKKQAETPYALDRMKRLSTEVLADRELAVQQHIIIPLSIALNHYVNIMYDAIERSDKEE